MRLRAALRRIISNNCAPAAALCWGAADTRNPRGSMSTHTGPRRPACGSTFTNSDFPSAAVRRSGLSSRASKAASSRAVSSPASNSASGGSRSKRYWSMPSPISGSDTATLLGRADKCIAVHAMLARQLIVTVDIFIDLAQQLAKGFTYSHAHERGGINNRPGRGCPARRHVRFTYHISQITFIELNNQRQGIEIETHPLDVVGKVLERFSVVRSLRTLRIGDEYHAVGAGQLRLAGTVMSDLAGHGIQLELHQQAGGRAKPQWEQVEKQCAIVARFERHHLSLELGPQHIVQPHEIGGLTAQRRSVIDQLENQAALGGIKVRHIRASRTE